MISKPNLYSAKPIKIGVLGGIGPEATAEFYNKLIIRLQEKGLIKSNKDFPQIIINSIPAPELIYDNISEDELKPYLLGLQQLEQMNVEYIVMVCNTIHLYHEQLQTKIRISILDLREELKSHLEKSNVNSALIMGTPSTIKKGLYKFDNIKTFAPNNEEMTELTNAIFDFNRGNDREQQVKNVSGICKKYMDQGAETIILGCTELALMLKDETLPKIDTMDILIEATINRFLRCKEG